MFEIVTSEQFSPQPWKNGGGSTIELYRFPVDSVDFDLRLSLATIERSGPFSAFKGYTRVITQLSGPPMGLTHGPAEQVTLEIMRPHTFDGATETSCKVSGQCRDFNLIVKAGVKRIEARVVEQGSHFDVAHPREGGWLFAYRLGVESGFPGIEKPGSLMVMRGDKGTPDAPVKVKGAALVFCIAV